MTPSRGMKLAARFLVEEPEGEERDRQWEAIEDEADGVSSLESLEQTLAALRSLPKSFDSEAPRFSEPQSGTVFSWRGLAAAGVAAAILILVFLPEKAVEAPPWDWVQRAEVDGEKPRLPFLAPHSDSGTRMGAPGGAGVPSEVTLTRELGPWTSRRFLAQFRFEFRIPQQLPGGWTFERATPIDEGRLRLRYRRAGDPALDLYLAEDSGPDGSRAIMSPLGELRVDRRSGLALAIPEARAGDPLDPSSLLPLFAPE